MGEDLKVYRAESGALRLVGSLNAQTGEFSYAEQYASSPDARPISVTLPLRAIRYSSAEAMPFFEGLVPEGMARQLAAAELKVRESDYLSILGFCGLDCIGDLLVTPEDNPNYSPSYEPVDSRELRRLFSHRAEMAELNGSNRLSLAGTQSKIGLAHVDTFDLNDGWLRGLNGAASTHILKLSSRDDISYFELLCMRAAEACGLRVAQTSLIDFGAPVVCSLRFDRLTVFDGTDLHVTRLHQEDFCQAFGMTSGSKYAELEGGTLRSIAQFLLEHSKDPTTDLLELAKLVCYNYLIGNCDNHLKNTSIIYGQGWEGLSLAPSYDLVCTTWYPDLSRRLGMSIGGVADIDAVGSHDFHALALEMGVSKRLMMRVAHSLAEQFDDAVRGVRDEWSDRFEELDWKAGELLKDAASRRLVLSHV